MAESKEWPCQDCGGVEFTDEDDGYRYCVQCGSKIEEFLETENADEDFLPTAGERSGAIYSAIHSRHRRPDPPAAVVPLSQSQFWSALTLPDSDEDRLPSSAIDDGVGPIGPEDFGWIGKSAPSFEDYHNEVRIRYVMGLQLMIQFQCEALVRAFDVSPLVCGLAGTFWLRFLAAVRVFDDGWVDEAINESESQQQEDPPENFKPRYKYTAEPYNMYGQRAVMIWLRWLKKTIPLSHTLAISFLACHVAREAVLPTDIERWSVEGKLPYFSAYVEVEKQIGEPSKACLIHSSFMFRPDQTVTAQKIESIAASIAESIGFSLPPVNFHAIASRYLQKLGVPSAEILPHALRIYEWSLPSELWLSSNDYRLPSRVTVISILIVAIRIRYNINGFGVWEKSLSGCDASSSKPKRTVKLNPKHNTEYHFGNGVTHNSDDSDNSDNSNTSSVRATQNSEKSESETAEILHNLEARYHEITEPYEYAKDLPTFLEFCKDVVFAGDEPSFDDREERKFIDEFWNIYQNDKDSEAVQQEMAGSSGKGKRARTHKGFTSSNDSSSIERSVSSGESDNNSRDGKTWEPIDRGLTDTLDPKTTIPKDEPIRSLKLDMKDNLFYYIPPRVKVRRRDYLHYSRRKVDGVMKYIAHADYYLLLRACAKAAEIDIRLMHLGVLNLERRLDWIEKRIERCLHMKLPMFSCEFCSVGSVLSLGLSDMDI